MLPCKSIVIGPVASFQGNANLFLSQLLLDPKDEASNAIFDFIEEALDATESVLVHSVRGQSRATCALAAYICASTSGHCSKVWSFLTADGLI